MISAEEQEQFILDIINQAKERRAKRESLSGCSYPLAKINGEPVPLDRLPKRQFNFLITKQCNMKCPFCIWNNTPKEPKFVTPAFFEEVIIKLKPAYGTCGLVGGEVGIHPQFRQLIDILVKHKMKFTLVSNCLKWEMYKFLVEERKYKKYFEGLSVSLDGTRETHDRYRGEGSYDRVIEAIEYFITKCKKPHNKPNIKMVLRKDNNKDVMHVFGIAKKYGLSFEAFDVVIADDFVLTQQDFDFLNALWKNHNKEFEKYKRRNKFMLSYSVDYLAGFSFCRSLDNRGFLVYPNGEIGFCCSGLTDEVPIANIKKDSAEEIIRKKGIVGLYLLNKIYPLIMAGVPVAHKDSCALCRECLGCLR